MRKRILIVDDEEENRRLLEIPLQSKGYDVVPAGNGVEALTILRQGGFDLVISDVLMPEMDGYQLCRKIKTDRELSRIPFFFYAASYTEDKDEEQALRMGADKFVRRSGDPEDLLSLVVAVLESVTERKPKAAPLPLDDEASSLKLYNQRLVRKLQTKAAELGYEIRVRRNAEASLRRMNRAMRALSSVNRAVTQAVDEQQLIQDVCRTTVDEAGYRLAWVGFAEHDHARTVRPVAQYGYEEGYLNTARVVWADTERGRGPTGDAVPSGKTFVVRDVASDPRYEPWRAEAMKRGYASSAAIPLFVDGKVIGALNVYAEEPDSFDEDEIRLLEDLSDDLGHGIHFLRVCEEKKRIREERDRLFNLSLDMLCVAGFDGFFKQVNPAWTKTLGWTEEELLSKPMIEFVHPDDREPTQNAGRQLANEQPVLAFENRYICRDGSFRWLSWNSFPLSEEGLILAVVRDVKPLKKATDDLRESEARYRTLFESAPLGIGIAGQDGKIVESNEAMSKLTGYSLDELNTLDVENLYRIPEQRAELLDILGTQGFIRDFEVELQRKDGTAFTAELCIQRIFLQGEPHLLTMAQDTTERKTADGLIHRQVSFLETLLAAIPGPVFYKNTEHVYLGCNEAFCRFVGLTKDRIVGKSVYDVAPHEFADKYWQMDEELFRNQGTQMYETAFQSPDGTLRDVMFHKAAFTDHEGKLAGIIGVILDITERKQAEEALRESEANLRKAHETAKLGSWTYDLSGRISWSDELYRIYGTSPETFSPDSSSFFSLIHPDDRPAMQAWIDDCIAKKKPGELVFRTVRPDGTIRFVSGRGELVCDEEGSPLYMTGTAQDITERKQVEEALRASEEKFSKAFQNSPDAITLARLSDGRLIEVNERFISLTGYKREEVLGRTSTELDFWANPADRETYAAALKERGRVTDFETAFRTKSGEIRSFVVSGECVKIEDELCVLGILHDISERRRTEQTLLVTARRLRTAVEAANVGLWDWDLETNEIYYSPEWKGQIGYEEDEISRAFSEWESRVHPDDLEQTVARVMDYLQEPWPDYVNEFRLRHKDGSYRWIRAQGSLLRDGEGNPVRMLGCHLDFTESKRKEREMQEQTRFLEGLLESVTHPFYVVDADDYTVVLANAAALKAFAKGESTCHALTHGRSDPCNSAKHPCPLQELKKSGKPTIVEHVHCCTSGGTAKIVEIHAYPVFGASGSLKYMVEYAVDITERRKMEESLRAGEKKYRTLFEQSAEAIIIVLHEGEIVDANQACSTLFGVPHDEIIGGNVLEFYTDPEDRAAFRQAVNREGFVKDFEVVLRRRDGNRRYCLLNSSLWRDDSGTPVGYLSIIRDITEQRRSREAQLRLATAIEQSAESVVITDAQRDILYANPAFERITGYSKEEVIGRHPRILRSDAHDESFYANLEESVKGGRIWSGRFIGSKKDGDYFHEDATISPVRDSSGKITNFVQLGHDVTERIQLENQLFQAQKMESIGTLAGGIAHDFNNLLTVIQGYSELLLTGTDKEASHYSDLKAIHLAAIRGADLVKRILTFSRKIETQPRPIDLNEEVGHANKLLYRTLPKMIDIELVLADALNRINADPGQMEQILLNLAVNARDSMPHGGKFIIETRNVALDADYCANRVDVVPGEYVLLKVSDSGHGMEREVQDRIFEPFYSTKKPGEGTGLGLAMVFGIVKGHGGHITCYSEPGVGTAFHIYFPVIEAIERDEEAHVREEPAGGAESLLLVDDEKLIRDLGTRLLRAAGYIVFTAENGIEAIELYEHKRADISLVILDLIMPKMGGEECLEGLLKVDPEVKVLIASGLLPIAATKEAIGTKAAGFVSKPFERMRLLQAVREVLDAE